LCGFIITLHFALKLLTVGQVLQETSATTVLCTLSDASWVAYQYRWGGERSSCEDKFQQTSTSLFEGRGAEMQLRI